MAKIQKLQVPASYRKDFTHAQREMLQEAMDKNDIQSLPPALITKARQAFRQHDIDERMALPKYDRDVHTCHMRDLPRELRS